MTHFIVLLVSKALIDHKKTIHDILYTEQRQSFYYVMMLTLSPLVTYQCMVEDLNIMITSLSISYLGNMSSRLSSNCEADASQLLDNLEEMFPRHL